MGKSTSTKIDVNEYRLSIHYGISWAVDGIKRILIGDKVAWEGDVREAGPINIDQPQLFGGPTKEGGVAGTAYFLPGREDQIMPTPLAERFEPTLSSTTCPAFRDLATIFFVGSSSSNNVAVGGNLRGGFYWTANSPFIQPASFDVWRAPKGLNPDFALFPDDAANPIHIIFEAMTETDWGMGAPTYQFNIPNWEEKAEQIFDEGFGLSLIWTDQTEIEAFASEILDHIQATLYVSPRTGLFEIKLLRDDYDIGSLRTIHPGNASFSGFARKLWGETANEIVVSYTDPANEKEVSVTAHDLANIVSQGGVISDSRHYYGIRNAELAAKVAARDVRTAAAPLATFEAELDRSFWDTLPGEVMIATWPEKDIENVVVRVMKVRYGKRGSSAVKVTLAEDVFSLARPPVGNASGTGWDGAAEAPAPMAHAVVFTLPLFFASQQLGATIGSLTYPEVVAGILAAQPGNDTFSYNLYGQAAAANNTITWQNFGSKSLLGRALMATPLYAEATSVIAGLPLLEQGRGPVESGFVIFGDGTDTGSEIGMLDSLNEIGEWTVARGVLDTVPRPWPVETPVWFVPPDSIFADTSDIRSLFETAEYKLLPRTSLGQLPLGDAPVVAGVMSARPHLPLRPANVRINGTGGGEVDATAASELVITWATRNRLLEDGMVTRWGAAAVAPEYGQETIVSVYRESGDLMFQVRGLWAHTTTTLPIAWVQEETRVFIRVSSERAGLGSLQSYGLWVKNIPQVPAPSAPPSSPVIIDGPPAPPDPEPDPTPDPLPPPDPSQPEIPGGGGGAGEWWLREIPL